MADQENAADPLLDVEDLIDHDELDVTDPDDVDIYASNDEWAFRRADRLREQIAGRVGVDRRTEGEVFDAPTLMALHKLLTSGVLKSLDFPLSTGKEANVFRGTTPTGGLVAVKIYRINTSTFKHVLKYIQGDERFQGVSGDKRALVYAWAQKEYRNLSRMYAAGVSVPEPIHVLKNVLVTEFIGIAEGAWPQLRDIGRLDELAQPFWDALLRDYAVSYNDAGLVHADFSEYNILVEYPDDPKRARPRVIDVGQAVLTSHPMAHEFLERDARNLVRFFRRNRLRVDERDLLSHLKMEDP